VYLIKEVPVDTPFTGRLLAATNAHDVDAIVACFAPGYVNETPCHPARGFTGRDQVRANWTSILATVPDLRAEVVAAAVSEGVEWTQWEMRGTRLDGTAHHLAGVIVFEVEGDVATACRFFLEPVESEV
jgi:hypothetical protein